jgi:hypothetical protein
MARPAETPWLGAGAAWAEIADRAPTPPAKVAMMMRTIRSASSFRAEYRNSPAAVAGIGEMEADYAG